MTNAPALPQWLINAADSVPPAVKGVAIGFAAAGWVAGWQAATATEQPANDEPAEPAEVQP